MSNSTLDAFVKAALDRGLSRESISGVLVSAGWTRREVDDALSGYATTDFGMAVPRPRAYVSARETFLYIVLFILLGVVAWNLGSLLFALVDIAFPDRLDADYMAEVRETQIRYAISGLVVGAPVFGWLALHIRKQRRTNPAMQRSRVRKWLTYLALVIAACALIGDATALVYNFLSGELSARLAMKLLVIAAIAGGVFFYFIQDAEKGDEHDQAS
jgi:hypothetical protein